MQYFTYTMLTCMKEFGEKNIQLWELGQYALISDVILSVHFVLTNVTGCQLHWFNWSLFKTKACWFEPSLANPKFFHWPLQCRGYLISIAYWLLYSFLQKYFSSTLPMSTTTNVVIPFSKSWYLHHFDNCLYSAIWSGSILFSIHMIAANKKLIVFTTQKQLRCVLICSYEVEYIQFIIIVTWSGVLYHVEWMRSYHRITRDG